MARLLVHFLASRQLNSISALSGEKTFALVNLLVTMQLLTLYSHRVKLHNPQIQSVDLLVFLSLTAVHL